MHNSCLCNEEISLRNRVLMKVPEPDPIFVRRARSVAHRIADWLGRYEVPMDGEWIERYSGRKRTLYENARLDLMFEPIGRRDRYTKSFIKAEKISDVTKDPRMIQARMPRYNYEIGNFLKPLEHKLYRLKGTRCLKKLLPPTRLIAKGLDSRARASLIREKLEQFPHGVCYGIDASRFDAHVSKQLLTVEHSVYLRSWRGNRLLQKLLSYQIVNHGWTGNGIRYKCPGGRMSGDMNTALGNCILMVIIISVSMANLGFGPSQWDMLCDGDDALIFVNAGSLRPEHLVAQMARAGMTIKIESVAREVEEVEFCQSKPVFTEDGEKMVRDPTKVLSMALASNKWFREPRYIDGHLTRLGKCYLSIAMGVPVLQEFALAMLRNGKGRTLKSNVMTGAVYKAIQEYRSHEGVIAPVQISSAARISFAEAFNISLDEQFIIESNIASMVL